MVAKDTAMWPAAGIGKIFLTPLRTRLLLLVLLALLPAFGFILYSAFEQRREATSSAYERALRRIQYFAADQRELIEATRTQLITLAQLPIVRQPGGSVLCNQTFALLLRNLPQYSNMGVAGPDGELRCSAMPLTTRVNISDRKYFREAIKTRDFVVGEFIVGRVTGKPVVTAAYPLLNTSGGIEGVVYIAIDPFVAIQASLARVPLPEGSALLVIDDEGTLLGRHPDSVQWAGKSMRDTPLFQGILSQQGVGSVEAIGVDGIARLYVFKPFPLGTNRQAYISAGTPLTAIYADVDYQFQRNLALMFLMTILALATAWASGTVLILRPAYALIAAARTLGQGNLQARTQLPHTTDEFGQLAKSLDEMAASLEQREQKLRAAENETRLLNNELEQRVLDRTAQLHAANKELEAFSYSVSHDLRTPLRSIDGFSQALLDDNAGQLDEGGKSHLQRIRAATQRMGQLIDDLLNLAHVTRTPMGHEIVDISSLSESIVAELRSQDKERAVQVDIQPDLTAEGDSALLRIMLENLLNNAWKFTGKTRAAHIELGRTAQTKTEQTFFIRDNGAGFDMTYAGNLFGAFQRLHNASEFAGSGIGLATAQRILARHGGRINASSTVGQGAVFYFTLPNHHNEQHA